MRLSVAVAVACLLLVGLSVATESEATIRKPINISAQGLGAALQTFAKEWGFQIVYVSDQVEELRTRGATGELTTDEALTQILHGTGMTFRYFGENAVSIVPAAGSAVRSDRASRQTGSASPDGDATVGDSSFSSSDKKGKSFWSRILLAQTENNQSAQQSDASQSSAAGTPSSEAPGSSDFCKKNPNDPSCRQDKITEIVVTAQRREEKLREVPISMSVVSGEDLDRSSVAGVTDAINRVPGVTTLIGTLGGGTQVVVRGVTAASPVLVGTSPVGYYLDSVPFGLVRTAVAPDSNPYDLERIEVLRGPQGTLYGASSANGVVRVLTKDPVLDEFELKMRTSASGTKDGGENYHGDLAVNAPIVRERLAARAVLGYENLSGWIDRPNEADANDAELKNFRLKVKAQPKDNLSIGFSAWLSRTDHGARSTGDENRTSLSRLDEPVETNYDAYGITLGYDFANFSLSSMSGYLDYTNDSRLDYQLIFNFPNEVLFTGFDSRVLSQEINLTSTHDGAWKWTLGGLYRDGEDRFFQWRSRYANPNGNRSNDTSESFALFGELTRSFFGERFDVTAGLRYFEDKQVMEEISRLDVAPGMALNPPLFIRESKFDALSPRVALTWRPSDQLTTYASYGEGFRSGFSQLSVVLSQVPGFPAVEPDNLANYEVGVKSDFWDGRFNFEAAAYYIEWEGIQQSLQVLVSSGTGTSLNVAAPINGQSASGVGFEVGVAASPFSGLTVGANYSRNDLAQDADVFSGTGRLLFLKGDRLGGSPEQTVGASADYVFRMGGNGYEGRLSASANYHSALERRIFNATTGTSSILDSDSLLVSRASFAVDSPHGWSITAFADDINDEKGSPNADATPAQQNVRIRPRTAGLMFEYRY